MANTTGVFGALLSKAFETYCQNVCQARCCKRGKLPLRSSEVTLFDATRIDERNHYTLEGGCQHLNPLTNACTIYEERPTACRTYPYHKMGPVLLATTDCPGVEEGLLDEDIKLQQARKI